MPDPQLDALLGTLADAWEPACELYTGILEAKGFLEELLDALRRNADRARVRAMLKQVVSLLEEAAATD
jgi:hypothetical protein